jgi:hypothetical protein
MKPKPFSELNHLTVPTAITICLYFIGPQLFCDRVLLGRTQHENEPIRENPRQGSYFSEVGMGKMAARNYREKVKKERPKSGYLAQKEITKI